MESASGEAAPATEIGHVLFVDIVGYSRQSTSAQSRLIAELTAAVNATPSYEEARARGHVLPLATGDGMALVFFHDVSLPARVASELAGPAVRAGLPVRMGIHSGLVQRRTDISGRENAAGEGINTAQRIMDFGEAGHILASGQYADWLGGLDEWRPRLADLGEGVAKHGLTLHVFGLNGPGFGRPDVPRRLALQAVAPVAPSARPLSVVVLYKRRAEPDETVLAMLERHLKGLGHDVFIDRHLAVGVEWARAIEERIRTADAVVALISEAAVGSEMLEYELETVADEFRRRCRPVLLPVRIGSDQPLEGNLGAIVNPFHFTVWRGPEDDGRVAAELASAMVEPSASRVEEVPLEPVGGAVPLESPFYIERATDAEFMRALRANESILLVKGPRQIGKTSLIGRGANAARELGWRTATTDFQKLSASQLASDDAFYRLLAATLGRQFGFRYDFANEWLDVFGANLNLDNYMRALIESSDAPLVWSMDEADRLFGNPIAADFFGLVRSWHNARAMEPSGPWRRFTVVIGYATEAHLFIQDLNQSPFNVGRQLPLPPFDHGQIADLNARYGSPLRSETDIAHLGELVGGQPFLTRRALDVVARGEMTFAELLERADRDDGPFGDHLKRILISVSQMPAVVEALRTSLSASGLRDTEGYYRLLAAGVFQQTRDNRVVFSCELYRRYLGSHVAG